MASRCILSGCLHTNRLFFGRLTVSTRTVTPLLHENTANAIIVSTQLVCVRYGSFYNKKSADDIWNAVTGVSSQGRKRGRASRGKQMERRSFNLGLQTGDGPSGIKFPGLNTPLLAGSKMFSVTEGDAEKSGETFREKIAQARSSAPTKIKRFTKLTPLQRGWTGRGLGGLSLGPPDPVDGYKFEGFDSKILEHKRIAMMTRSQGKTQSYSCLAVTGNKHGLVGYAVGKSRDPKGAMRVAKNKAAQHLIYIDRYRGHTLYHNFYEKFHATGIIAQQRPKGHGLVCHRAIMTIAELAGIKDMYCKVEGRTKNYLSVTRAFFNGLNSQLTHQELANKTGYNVVEYRGESRKYPNVVASPTEKRDTKFVRDDTFDFEAFCYGGKVRLQKKIRRPPYFQLNSYKMFLARDWKRRNQRESQIERRLHGIETMAKWKKLSHKM